MSRNCELFWRWVEARTESKAQRSALRSLAPALSEAQSVCVSSHGHGPTRARRPSWSCGRGVGVADCRRRGSGLSAVPVPPRGRRSHESLPRLGGGRRGRQPVGWSEKGLLGFRIL